MKPYLLLAALLFLVCPVASLAQPTVQIGFGTEGLSSLTYNGQQFLSYGNQNLNAVTFSNGGQTVYGSVANTRQVDGSRGTVTQTFDWGSVVTTYQAAGNRLRISITTTNRSSNSINGLFFDEMGIQLPSAPQEYDGVIPILGTNSGSPTALRLTYGAGAVVLTNDDVSLPLTVGFPWALNRPTSTVFPIKINTARDGMYPTNIPYIDRPIAPGSSDTYNLSLRFGDSATPTSALAGDVYTAFAAAYPSMLNWQDRRPIGSLIIGTAATGWATNPRGWLLDSSIDVTTPAGVAAFQARLLTWADNAVSILKGMNAQGMITWDIEGEQFQHATTYIGDPRLFATLAPEMATVADAYFQKFRDAGLRVGVCIRPQQLVIAPDGKSASQQEVADPTQLLIDKMTYAKQRWGATLFYVDSNGDPNLPYDFKFFRRVAQALPDVLVIPEHKNIGYYGATAPYAELRQNHAGTVSTVPDVRNVYRGAFTMINTADGPIDARFADLQAAVASGDIMMFRGWFDDGNNAKIKALYSGQSAAPPVVSFVSPAANTFLSGSVGITAQASGQNGIAGVKLLVDNAQLGSEITANPYAWTWNSSAVVDGLHTLTLVARDSSGQMGTASETVFVSNGAAAPTVSIVSPAAGSIVSGSVLLQANATSGVGLANITYTVDGIPVSSPWDSTSVSNGTHSLTATARDTTGTSGTATVTFTVRNAAAAPTVSITFPAAGSTVTGSAVLQAYASSSIGIAGITFAVDGVAVPSAWDSTSVSNGTHSLTATAKDTAGTTATATISFTVRNAVAAPVVSFVSPGAGATVAGSVPLQANASSAIGIASVNFTVDGIAVASPWDTTNATNGTHVLTATAKDVAGAAASTSISVTVANAPSRGTALITSPGAGSTVHGMVFVKADANTSYPNFSMVFALDNNGIAGGWWDSTTVSNGVHTLSVVARDITGFVTTAAITINVQNGGISLPTVAFTSPASGATVSGSVTLSANAGSSLGIANVSFALDGSPVSSPWDTTSTANGTHVVTVTARDSSGASASASVTVTVANGSPITGTAAGMAIISSPTAGSTVSGSIFVKADANTPYPNFSMVYAVDNNSIGAGWWDTATVANGVHTLTVVARDIAGTVTTASVTFTVQNAGR